MQILTDQNGQEIKSHGTYAFPVLVSHERLSNYDRRTFLWHWHTELEWTYILEGEICYQVNEHVFYLKQGQGILCNSNVLHMGKAVNEKDCHYVSVTVHPRLYGGFENSFLDKQYVSPIVGSISCAYVLLEEDAGWKSQVIRRLRQTEKLYQGRKENSEFQIYLLLMENWLTVWENCWGEQEIQEKNAAESRNIQRLKAIFGYLHEHYAEKITLEDVAKQVNICKAECCRLFKKYMKESLFDYLLDYRIERSTAFLTEYTVIEAAERSGFASPAYYTKVFKERMGCTPKEYKKKFSR